MVKNWLDREGLQFIESLTEAEKDRCSTLQGLSEILTNKFRPQFSEMIKSLQVCTFIRHNWENAEEWMGRIWLSAIECNYKEIDRQLKEEFIYVLNDTEILGELIKELTKICENEEITRENVLSWVKRVEVQKGQSSIMNSLTQVKEFDKLKVVKSTYKESPRRYRQTKMPAKQTSKYCGSSYPPRQCLAYGKRCTDWNKIGHFRVLCRSRRAWSMNEVEQEAAEDSAKETSIVSVNINSIHFNKNCSILTGNLK